MSIEVALRARLLAASAVTAAVGTRIDWTQRPQATALPAIVLQVVSDARPQTMKALQEYRPTLVQVDVFAKTRGEVVTIREAAIAAVLPAATQSGVSFRRAMIDSVRDLSTNTDMGFVHRDSIDITLWHDA